MAMPAIDARRWTAREVRDLIDKTELVTPRYELVDGELLVTPSPHFVHQRAVTEILFLLGDYLRSHPVGFAVTSPSDIELEPEFISQPDGYVVPIDEALRLREGGKKPVHKVMLAIEVISPSSGRYDRVTKRLKYQRHVPEYWIIDIDARIIERWTPTDTRPEILTSTLTWTPAAGVEPFVLDIARYFTDVAG
jgi:Uma2 family endonuclease